MSKSKVYKTIPQEIKNILIVSEGWLVGSAAQMLTEGTEPRDYDIIIPSREKFQDMMLILQEYKSDFNTYGGLKFQVDDMSVDIWCEELSHFLLSANKVGYVYNMKRNILLKLT